MIKSIMSPEHFDLLKEERERRRNKLIRKKFPCLTFVTQNYPLYPEQLYFCAAKFVPKKVDLISGYVNYLINVNEEYTKLFRLYEKEPLKANKIEWWYDRRKGEITLISQTYSKVESKLLQLDCDISCLFGIPFEYKRFVAPFLFAVRYDRQAGNDSLVLMFRATTMASDLLNFCNEYLFVNNVNLEVFKCLFLFDHNVKNKIIYVKNIGTMAYFLSKLEQSGYLKSRWQYYIGETGMLYSKNKQPITSSRLQRALSEVNKRIIKYERHPKLNNVRNVPSRKIFTIIDKWCSEQTFFFS